MSSVDSHQQIHHQQSSLIYLDHFIDGEYTPSASGQLFDDLNPATGKVLAKVALGEKADIDKAVEAAKLAFDEGKGVWPQMPIAERCKILKKIGDLIFENKAMLAGAETLDTGKPIAESLEGDITRSAHNFHFFAEYAPSLNEDCFTNGPNERHLAIREPLGVVGLITPWNLPLYLATWKIAPALAMGNTIVLKPAEWTPYTATLLGDICNQAGLPKGVLNIVHGFGTNDDRTAAGESLTRHPDVKAISFTGETGTGKAIMAAAAETLKKVSFELGGKGATVIFEDANLDEAIPNAVRAAYRNQGQVCLAGSRLYIQAAVYETVLKRVLKEIEAIKPGNPLDPKTRMGALVHPVHLAKVQEYLALGDTQGNVRCGGKKPVGLGDEFEQGCFLEPTVVTDLPANSELLNEEIFGPVLSVIKFDTEADVIAMVNSTPYGLSSSIWSQDVNRCHRVSQGIRMGMVWVNCWFVRDLRAPFGGQKASGVGREGGRYSLEFFSEAKTITYRYQ